VWIAIAAAALIVLVPSAETATAGCSPNVAWQDRYPQWSPTGDRFVFLRETVACGPAPNDLVIADRSGRTIRSFHVVGAAAWSPDGRRLAFVDRSGLRITDPNGARTEAIGSGGTWLTWGAPGLAFLRSGTLWVVDPGRVGERQIGAENRLRGPIAWTPTNEVVATRVERPGDDETMQLVRVGLDGTVTALTPASGRYGRMTVSGASGRIVVSHRPRGVEDWQLDELDPRTGSRRVFFDSPALDVEPVFGPDGLSVAFVKQDRIDEGTLSVLTPVSGESSLGFDAHPFSAPSWAPADGGILYAAGHECQRWGIYRAPTARLTNRCRFTGTTRADTLHGSPFRDFLVGREGRDRLVGGGGRDSIDGGSGDDLLDGGGDWDVLFGRGGADVLLAGGGPDEIRPGSGRDRVDAGRGNDVVHVRDGWRDVVRCGAGRGDIVVADRLDVVADDCERVERV
jgi:RTX calcium-binding nonapeptide repeat (4 copies)/WD40-like Beta Propeller Repeat